MVMREHTSYSVISVFFYEIMSKTKFFLSVKVRMRSHLLKFAYEVIYDMKENINKILRRI